MKHFKSYEINIDGLKVRYYAGGKGEPLLIIHGGNSHAGNWLKNAAELKEKYTVYIPDLPGFGLSQPLPGNYNVSLMVQFIENFVREIGLNSFYLMGHSLGGSIAINFVLQYPKKVRKLILVNSMSLGEEIALWVRVLSRPTLCQTVGKCILHICKGIKWFAEGIFRSMDFIIPFSQTSLMIGCTMVNLEKQAIILKDRLPEIAVPTLVIWGKHDFIVPVKHAFTAANMIPDCKVKIFTGGHSAYSRCVPEFTSSVTSFLQ